MWRRKCNKKDVMNASWFYTLQNPVYPMYCTSLLCHHTCSLVPRLFPHDKSLGTRLACTRFAKSCASNAATVLRTEIGPINCHKSGSYSNFWHTACMTSELQRSVASISPKPAKLQETSSAHMCILNERYRENWITSYQYCNRGVARRQRYSSRASDNLRSPW